MKKENGGETPAKSIIVLLVLMVFGISVFVHFLPLFKKGFPFDMTSENLIVARNFALTGKYALEDERNIILSSSLVSEKGQETDIGNRLTPLLYSQIFKIFGFSLNLPIYISIILWSLSISLLFILVYRLFNLLIALIFSLLNIFIPVLWQGSLIAGFYEFAVLFFTLGLIFYFATLNKKLPVTSYRLPVLLILSSIFFALAAFARNAFLISFLPFIVFDLWKFRSLKRLLFLSTPFLLFAFCFLLFSSENLYLSNKPTTFGHYAHLFPDPYVYHFEKEEYIKSIEGTLEPNYVEFLEKYGYSTSIKGKILMYLNSLFYYPKEFIKIITWGGGLIIGFMVAGIVYLLRYLKLDEGRWREIKGKDLGILFITWFSIWYLVLILLKTNNWDHFLELQFPLTLIASLGIFWLQRHILQFINTKRVKLLFVICYLLFVILHLVQSSKWMFHEEYSTSKLEESIKLAEIINKKDLTDKDVIAVGLHPSIPYHLNLYTNKSYIYFTEETVQRLVEEDKLSSAFDYFRVTYIAGYEEELTKEIKQKTNIKTIE